MTIPDLVIKQRSSRRFTDREIPLEFPGQHPSAPERRKLNDYLHNKVFT